MQKANLATCARCSLPVLIYIVSRVRGYSQVGYTHVFVSWYEAELPQSTSDVDSVGYRYFPWNSWKI